MGFKKKGKQNKGKEKKETSAESEQKLHCVNELQQIIQDVDGEKQQEKETFEKVMHPLTRCTSQPIVHEEAIRKSLFWDDSKSVDYGFEPNPQNQKPVILEDYTDDSRKEFKGLKPTARTSQLSFMANSKPDDSDQKLLDGVKQRSSRDFLRNRVGRKNLNAIMKQIKFETEDLDESALLPRPVRNRRIAWIMLMILVILISATTVALTMTLTSHSEVVFIPTTAPWFPTVKEGAIPYEYLPPGKVFQTLGSHVDFDLSCNYVPHSLFNPQQISILVIYSFLERGMSLGNGYGLNVKEDPSGDFTAKYTVVWNYRKMIPACLWYGMDFVEPSLSMRGQFYILLEEVVMTKLMELYKINCTTVFSSLRDDVSSLEGIRRVGVVYQNSVTPVLPQTVKEDVPDELKGIVRRKYPELKALYPDL